jgi:hypothetical protein
MPRVERKSILISYPLEHLQYEGITLAQPRHYAEAVQISERTRPLLGGLNSDELRGVAVIASAPCLVEGADLFD